MGSQYRSNMGFEADVRRTAEAIWGLEPGDCQPEHYSSDPIIKELDGLARLRDVAHLLMATTSRKLDKVKGDVKKLEAAKAIEEKRGVPAAMWLITREQVDAEHVKYARSRGVTLLTLDAFKNRFFQGREYLRKRRSAAFGSARNLESGSVTIDESEYVEPPMRLTAYSSGSMIGGESESSVNDVVRRLQGGEMIVIMAPFGSGKSLTSMKVHLALSQLYVQEKSSIVPLAINLREHWGQDYGDEMLERHARSIGFSPRESLTVAWRAGLVSLILDGFDEVATQAVVRTDAQFLREVRFRALQGVRDLITHAPDGVGVLVSGREHYFDSAKDLVHALGLGGRKFSILRLGEFTEAQASEYLTKKGLAADLPDWLPRKPLILGYLAHRGLLPSILRIDEKRGFGYAWDEFLRLICDREASHERAVMDSDTVRKVLERLACDVRSTISGTGPISGVDLSEAYRVETGQVAGEGVLMQLQRLPGLTERDHDPGTRSFIDQDFLAALQGSAVSRFILEGTQGLTGKAWLGPLAENGISMASYLVQRAGGDKETVLSLSTRLASENDGRGAGVQLSADALMIAMEVAGEEGTLDCRSLVLEGVSLGRIDLEELEIRRLTLRHSIVDEIIVGVRAIDSSLRVESSEIRRLGGVASRKALPDNVIADSCEVQEFDDMSTNSAILRLDMPAEMKALVTVLRKLYVQAGGGRQEGALKRGIPSGPIGDAVDDVVQILQSEGIVTVNAGIVHPVRRQASRVFDILQAPTLSRDPIVERVKHI